MIVAQVYDALSEAGTSKEKAKAAVGAIPLAERLATKEDLAELKAQFNDLKVSINEHFAKIERDLALLKFGYGPAILALLVKIAFF